MKQLLRILKSMTPRPVVFCQAALRSAIHRRTLWSELLRECEGITDADQLILEKSRRAARKSMFRNPEDWLEPQSIADIVVRVNKGFHFSIRAHTDDLGHIRQVSHRPLLDAVLSHLPVGGVAVDAGANIGLFTANFSRRVGETGRVLAIEMMPQTAEQLRKTISLNQLGNVEVIEKAISDSEGKSIEIAMPDTQHYGQASIVRNYDTVGPSVMARTTTLDTITAPFQRVHVIKMDLEGAENIALLGAKQTLQKTDIVLYENHPQVSSVDHIFENAGFTVRHIDGINRVAVKSS